MSKQSDVKGCPLCGGDAGRDFDFKGKLVGARCSPCGLPWMPIERWNSRPPAHTEKLADALREMVDAMYRYQNDCDDSPPLAHREMMHRAEQALASRESRDSGDGWVREPLTEGGVYWWWNEDEDSEPIPVHIDYSWTDGTYFAMDGRYGWSRFQTTAEMGGWWMLARAPAPPTEGGAL